MKQTTKPYLYIPMEIKVREFPGKLLLAMQAAKRGYQVVFGRKAEIAEIMPHMPRGIYLASWAAENFASHYETMKKAGHVVAVMDEEGLVTFSDDMYARLKLSNNTMSQIDLFFTWGEKQLGVVKEYCKADPMPTLVNSGNVRVDILRPDYHKMVADEVADLKERYGRFILLNSSFGRANHYKGAEVNAQEQRAKKIIQSEEDYDFLNRYCQLQQNLIGYYLDAVPKIAEAFPDHQLIIRPHPSENFDTWRQAIQGHKNIHVTNEGAVHCWLLASEVLIHHFCTTALEAYVAGVPAVAFRPVKDNGFESDLTYRGGLEADSEEELLAHLKDVINGDGSTIKDKRAKERDYLKKFMVNLDGDFAYKSMIDAFDGCAPRDESTLPDGYFAKRRIKDVLRVIKRSVTKGTHQYVDHKFSSLSADEINAMIRSIDDGAANLELKKLSRFCFSLSR